MPHFQSPEAKAKTEIPQTPHASESNEYSLSASVFESMKDFMAQSKTAWSDIAHGKASLGEYGLAAMDIGMAVGLAGSAALVGSAALLAGGVAVSETLVAGGIFASAAGVSTQIIGEGMQWYDLNK